MHHKRQAINFLLKQGVRHHLNKLAAKIPNFYQILPLLFKRRLGLPSIDSVFSFNLGIPEPCLFDFVALGTLQLLNSSMAFKEGYLFVLVVLA